ncbi:type I-F CRISPR-associated endonuclease Cas1f [Oligella urethralis]|nr:type I-F CRISPR-associated endonuclease Cas1f [Oligella urethralis]
MMSSKTPYIPPSDLKTILHSKRANLYYLEHCRILVNGGRVEYITPHGKESLYWNIPIANTTSLLLGTGTSITQSAVRELAKAGVLVGFCGGGGTPLFASTEVEWLSPQSEYRPTQYLQNWCKFWFDDELRLKAAKLLQTNRLQYIQTLWPDESSLKNTLHKLCDDYRSTFDTASDHMNLLAAEGRFTSHLYRLAVQMTSYDSSFKRSQRGDATDPANRFLDHGNYLAYGLGATACWVLGLPFGLAVLHGKTRRGGLVFDAADIIKDAIILPQAFISAVEGDNEKEFRQACINNFTKLNALDIIIDTLKLISQQMQKK